MDQRARERGVAVVIRGDVVLMVEHAHPDRSIWTLPGGGVDPAETPGQAVVRELLEETGLIARSVEFLTQELVNGQLDHFFLVRVDEDAEPVCGIDPDLVDRPQILNAVNWVPIATLMDDCQMKVVLPLLGFSTSSQSTSMGR